MTQIMQQPLGKEIDAFLEEFGDEIEACSFEAFELLEAIIERTTDQTAKEVFQEFLWYYADELDVCNPDAFDMIYALAQQLKLEI